jgi:hypothetical protein
VFPKTLLMADTLLKCRDCGSSRFVEGVALRLSYRMSDAGGGRTLEGLTCSPRRLDVAELLKH